MVTAAAHRCGKQLVRSLAEEGYDLAICSLAVLASRVKTAEALGRRACALRLFTTAPVSAVAVVDEVHRRLGPIYALIHIDGDALLASTGTLDATSSAALPDLLRSGGTLLFLCEEPRSTPPKIDGIVVIVLSVLGKAAPQQVARAVMTLLRERQSGCYAMRNGQALERVG